MSLTIGEIAEALVQAEGIQADAAKILGVTRQAINARVMSSEKLQAIVYHEQESLADYGEGVIRKSLRGDDPKLALDAAKWVVARLRKDRFSERQEITGAGGEGLKIEIEYVNGPVTAE